MIKNYKNIYGNKSQKTIIIMNRGSEVLQENNKNYQKFSYIINRSNCKRPKHKIDMTDDFDQPSPPLKRLRRTSSKNDSDERLC